MSEAGAPAPEDPVDAQAWRSATEFPVPFGEALDAWADSAHTALAEIAHRYGAFISNAELAARAQADSGIATRAPVRTWVQALQRRITERCQAAGEPPLVALMVGHDQKVGQGYAYAVAAAGLPVPANLDQHAAAARFACYLHYGATVPAGAGPILPPKLEQARVIAQARAAKAAPAKTVRKGAPARVVKARKESAPRTPSVVAPAKAERPAPKLCPNCFTQLAANGVCGYC